MADAVTTLVIKDAPRFYRVHLTGISDGTGESNVIKVIKANLLAPPATSGGTSAAPVALDIVSVRWNVQGYTSIRLRWNRGTPVIFLVLGAGSGYDNFWQATPGGDFGSYGGLQDAGSGSTGDIELTSVGGVSGGTYDITLTLSKRSS